ncbi:hypothetical protein KAZ01_01500, partial [Candidatus Gracilibacteria bacterium]|nr:hypothetical protein [Candidatus Gracilibacteria bacterium]
KEISVPKKLLPIEKQNELFEAKLTKAIKEEINGSKDDINKDEQDKKIKFEKDENGNVTADFIKKVKADPNLNQKIIGIENLKEGCILKVTEKNPENNEDVVNYFKIKTLDYGKETLPRIQITNITSSGGQIKKNTSASDEEDISYNYFYKLFQKIDKGEIIKEEDFEKKKESGEIKEVIEDGKINTIEQLVEKLNEIDTEGVSIKFEKGLSFEIFGEEKGTKYGIFSISKLDENTHQIWVTNGQKEEGPFSYSDFLNLFETQEGKRFNPTGNIIGVLENIKTQSASDIQKGFENIEYDKDRKILIPTDKKEDKDFLGIEYFMNPKTGKAIKIQDLGENKLKLSFGEYKEAPKKDNDKDVQKPDVFKMESNPEICGYEMLYFLIQKHGCIPKIPKAEVKDKEVKDPPPMKGGFFKSWLSGVSVAQIIAGGKQFIDAIKHKLDQGSKINAARFALGLGKILPIGDNIRLDLKSSVYAADKKLIEEISGEICNLSTGDAVTRIKGILFNRGSPQYELFAGMIAALTKIGTIYPGELKNYRNNYMWYRAFGGTPNDKFMKSIMEEYKISGKQFNEENLMIEYFKKNSGPLGIRPTFFIDVIVAGNTGRSTNMKNGDNESKGMFTTDGKVDHTVKKLGDGEYYNALGAFKNIISQGGDSKQMYKFPFIMVMSGLVKNLNQEQIKEELKDQYLKSNPFPPLLFMESNEDIKLFQRVIIKLSSCISEEARKEAQEIVQFSKDPSTYKHPKDNKLNGLKGYVGLVSNFWDKHGDKLAPKMALTKDIEIYTKKDQDTDYKKYFNKIQGVAKDSEFLIKGEKIQAGFYNYNHSSVAIVDIENYLEKGVRNINSQGGMSDTGKQIFDQIIIGIDDIKNKKPFGTDEKANKSFQKQLFFNYHKGINKFIMGQSISSEKFKSTEYGTKLEKRNITIVETNRKDSSYLETEKYKQTVNTDFENYLISKQKTTNTTETTKEDTKRSVNKIITSQPFGSTKIQSSTKPSGPKKSTKNNEGNSEDEEENE